MTTKFQQRHYEAIARLMVDHQPVWSIGTQNMDVYNGKTDQWIEIVESLCHEFAQDNPRFKKTKFLKACGWMYV